ncbi:hypothetical protein C8R45DRAFT_1039235 [Mycena sanguinolenta]|nr:hypothetical protein C8R45DRAFT_1039235 [Mycena sanguinolenta]
MSTAQRVLSLLCIIGFASAQAPLLPQCAQGCANEAAIQVGCALRVGFLGLLRIQPQCLLKLQPRMPVQDVLLVQRDSVFEDDFVFDDGAK